MLLQAICRIGIFMICAQAIIQFRPREAYEKYLKLLVGVMILIQLFLPLGSFLLGGGMEETLAGLEQFRTRMEGELEAAAREAEEAEKLLEQMTLEEVRRRMEEQSGGEAEGQDSQGSGAGGTDSRAGGTETQESSVEEVPEVSVKVGPIEIQ